MYIFAEFFCQTLPDFVLQEQEMKPSSNVMNSVVQTEKVNLAGICGILGNVVYRLNP